MSKPLQCPGCGGSISEKDIIVGYANILTVDDEGTPEWTGTRIDWETHQAAGSTHLFQCDKCSRVFDSINPLHEVDASKANITVMTWHDMTWVCPQCGNTCVHTYEDLIESGCPMCVSCDDDGIEMDRLQAPNSPKTKRMTKKMRDKIRKDNNAKHTEKVIENLVDELSGDS